MCLNVKARPHTLFQAGGSNCHLEVGERLITVGAVAATAAGTVFCKVAVKEPSATRLFRACNKAPKKDADNT